MGETSGRTPLVVVAGNPNTGKTSLFNRLTGLSLRVGNYPGITVDRHRGDMTLPGGGKIRLEDVPGSYSLSSRSAEEQLALYSIAGLPPFDRPDLVVIVVDATQLTRNLYLVLQVLELHLPVVIALSMTDLLEGRGQAVDAKALATELGVPVVPCVPRQGEGLDALSLAIEAALADPATATPGPRWVAEDPALYEDITQIAASVPPEWARSNEDRQRAIARWALLSIDEEDELEDIPPAMRQAVLSRRNLAVEAGRDPDLELVSGRYSWIDEHAPKFAREVESKVTWTEKLDRVLLSPWTGFPVFLMVMGTMFMALFAWADPAIGLVEEIFASISDNAREVLPAGLFGDLIVEGVIAGVGAIVVFLPQILLLFLFIAILEDSGYMARVAFLMDRLMKTLGLHGRAFVPMLSGFACAIPAIMATRTMERKRDRMLTMMVVPLTTCSARLPVYALLIGALIPDEWWMGMPVQALTMMAMYMFGTVLALIAAAVLSRTVLKGPNVPFILELPPYRAPQFTTTLRVMWEKGRAFLTEAGTVILTCTIALWFLLHFPKDEVARAEFLEARSAVEARVEAGDETALRDLVVLRDQHRAAEIHHSAAGRLGRTIEPAIAPLGFDWKMGIGLIGAFAAREVFVSTMGLVYGIGDEVDEESDTLREKIHAEKRPDGSKAYTALVGLSLMVFFALACQCMSTLAVVKRETQTWRWPLFMFVYMTALAWICSFAVYQGGLWLGYT
tara:strand:+ start:6666 stop:8867 length:2202 start_codon:yes stop_codon:yes gene_type:complete